MTLSAEDILRQMLASIATQLASQSANAIAIAEKEISAIAKRVVFISLGYLSGDLNKTEAQTLLAMQLTSSKEALSVAEGFGLILAEKIPNDAMNSVKGVINGLLQFNLV